jgi:hypothetical protein
MFFGKAVKRFINQRTNIQIIFKVNLADQWRKILAMA